MSDEHNIYEPNDRFSDYMRQRLTDHPTPLDDACWDEIASRIEKKRASVPVWRMLAAAAAVLLFGVVLLYHRLTKEDRSIQEMISQAPVTVEESIEKKADPDQVNEEPVTMRNVDRTMVTNHSSHTDSLGTYAKETHALEAYTPETKASDVAAGTVPPETTVLGADVPEGNETKTNETKTNEPDTNESEANEPGTTLPSRTKKSDFPHLANQMAYNSGHEHSTKQKKGWQLSAGFGSGSGLGDITFATLPDSDYENPNQPGDFVTDPSIGNEGLESGGDKNNQPGAFPLENEYIVGTQHAAPLSIGITVRKKLNKTWGIETGFVYSYLSSDLEFNRRERGGTLKLHYVGVPVHLVANLWDKRAWNVYVSGGGMVEKGLRSVFTRTIRYKSDHIEGATTSSSISGLQWSVSGGIGLSYRFYKGMNLFFEPGVSYYFDGDQPISRRTEEPFNFNLRLGLRYDF